MAIVSFSETIDANTNEANAKEIELKIPKGIIKSIFVVMPTGCVGLVKMQMFYQEVQIFPMPRGTFLAGDGIIQQFNIEYPAEDNPFKIVIKMWNEDTKYNHTISGYIDVKTERKGEISRLDRLINIIERLILFRK